MIIGDRFTCADNIAYKLKIPFIQSDPYLINFSIYKMDCYIKQLQSYNENGGKDKKMIDICLSKTIYKNFEKRLQFLDENLYVKI